MHFVSYELIYVVDSIQLEKTSFFLSMVDVLRDSYTIRSMIPSFLNENINQEDKWFRSEIENFLGIDVYSQEFNNEKGYSIYYNERNQNSLVSKIENTKFYLFFYK